MKRTEREGGRQCQRQVFNFNFLNFNFRGNEEFFCATTSHGNEKRRWAGTDERQRQVFTLLNLNFDLNNLIAQLQLQLQRQLQVEAHIKKCKKGGQG